MKEAAKSLSYSDLKVIHSGDRDATFGFLSALGYGDGIISTAVTVAKKDPDVCLPVAPEDTRYGVILVTRNSTIGDNYVFDNPDEAKASYKNKFVVVEFIGGLFYRR